MQTIDSPGLNLEDDFIAAQCDVDAVVFNFAPDHDMVRVRRAFALVGRAYDGWLPGYQRLQTLYHNHLHTLEVVMCAARLLHGLYVSGRRIEGDVIDTALVAALLHDAGYLKHDDEGGGSGAQFTLDHVARGVAFARDNLHGEPPAFVEGVANAILITDHRLPVDRIAFAGADEEVAAMVTGTADLVAQMANRVYLERLTLLFIEFKEAGIGGFDDVDTLLEKTAAFYRVTKERLDGPLQDYSRFLAKHFEIAEGVTVNRYQESIDKNLAYLEQVLQEARGRRVDRLQRGGIVRQALKLVSA